MQSAPAVSYPVGRSRFHAGLLAGLVVAVVLVLMVWLSQAQVLGMRHMGAVLLGLVTTGFAANRWWHSPTGALAWDGAVWSWSRQSVSEPVVPEVSLDLQMHMLLYLKSAVTRRGIWVWVDRQALPQRWRVFRQAIFAKSPLVDHQSSPVSAQDSSAKAQS